jgi:hypothetical protein
MRSSGVVIAAGGDISLAGMVTQGLQRFGAGWVFERLARAEGCRSVHGESREPAPTQRYRASS